ncbi:MAG: MCE family protein [Proteobacteria bacterium]|nr:MCE family protein [Pseudomonadota bacterium]
MNTYLSYRERMAGLFLVFAALGIVAFIVGTAIKNNWLEPRIPYHTHVVRGEGLRPGSPVLLSGVEVGEVGDLSILKDNRVDVEIRVRKRHAHRVREGTTAEVRRLLGIGEKRIYLLAPPDTGELLPPGALLPANEMMDILDAMSHVDLGRFIGTMDRAVVVGEVLLSKLEEEQRLERMMEAFDQMGPTMARINHLIAAIDKPLADLIGDPSLRRTFQGADKVFNDPQTRKAMRAVATTFDAEQMANLIARMEQASSRLADVLAEDGDFQGAMTGANRLLNDGRADRILTAMEKITADKKLNTLVDNLAVVADQTAKVGPEIPTMAKELISTLQEAVIVLKAVQKTWLLDDESKAVIKEIRKKAKQK